RRPARNAAVVRRRPRRYWTMRKRRSARRMNLSAHRVKPDAVALAVHEVSDVAHFVRQRGLGQQHHRAQRARPLERRVDAGGRGQIGHRALARRLVAVAVNQATAGAAFVVWEAGDVDWAEGLGLELAVEQLFVEPGRALEVRDRDFAPHYGVLHFILLPWRAGLHASKDDDLLLTM